MPMSVSVVDEARYLLQGMLFCCCFILSSQRVNMGIAMMRMVNWTTVDGNISGPCPMAGNKSALKKEDGEFDWSPPLQGHVHASYFYGLFLTQFPAEMLIGRFCARYMALSGMLLSTTCTLLIPVSASFHVGALISAQVIKALGHSLVMSAFSEMLSLWIPTKKMMTYASYATCGIPTGAFFTIIIGGMLCHYPEYGWPSVFYFSGTIGIIWCLFWLYLCRSIHFAPVLSSSNRRTHFPKNHLPVPYWKILSSRPVWGYVAAGIACYWMVALNIFVLPTYLRIVLRLEMEFNGLIASFPNVLEGFAYLFSYKLLRKRTTEKTTIRRFPACLGMAIFSACMVLMTFMKCARAFAILFMVLAIGSSGFTYASISIVPVTMSPNFSGILSAIMNTIGSLAGSALPLMVGYLMEGERTLLEWSRVFYACFFVVFISMILFMAFSSYEIQPWNDIQDSRISFIDIPTDSSLQQGSSSKMRKRKLWKIC